MNVHGYELISEWKNSTCGQTARATRGGKLYILKKYQKAAPVMNAAISAEQFEKNKKSFERYVELRQRINNTLRPIAGPGGNIIIPIEDFIEDRHYIEVSEFIDGAIPEEELEEVLNSLSIDMKRMLMLTATGALDTVHKRGIIHSDLKLKNILLVRNSVGNYVSKLIDFDSSYFTNFYMLEEIIGTMPYYSPELSKLIEADEDEKEGLIDALTTQSDIFSLGIIFHIYLSGEMPQAKSLTDRLQRRKDAGKPIYCWTILNSGCELAMSDKIKSLKYLSLIQDMLNIDPSKRPTATQVLQRLKAPDVEEIIEEPWPEHRLMLDKAKIKDCGYRVFKKINSSGNKKYELITKEGKRKEYSNDDLISLGLAKSAREEKFCEPWPEHSITFNEEKLRSRGFIAAEQKVLSGIKGYEIFRSDSTSTFFDLDKLIITRYAIKKTEPVAPIIEEFCEPWPEHSIEFDIERIKSRGFIAIKQMISSDKKGYQLVMSNGVTNFVLVETLLIQRYAKRK